jgi:hypothetical protein
VEDEGRLGLGDERGDALLPLELVVELPAGEAAATQLPSSRTKSMSASPKVRDALGSGT